VYKAAGIRSKPLIERGVESFLEVDDFGDYWRYDILIESVRADEIVSSFGRLVAGVGQPAGGARTAPRVGVSVPELTPWLTGRDG